jgi:protease IV
MDFKPRGLVAGFLISLILTVFFCTVSFSLTVQEGFMKSSNFVRQAGMGGAATAVCDDLSSIYYNPAGLAKAGALGFSFGTIDTNKEILDENRYYCYNLGTLAYLGYDKILPTGEKIKADTIGMGVQTGMGISYGLTYKNIFIDTNAKELRGYSADVGLLLKVTPQVSIGVLGQDALSDKVLDINSSTRVGAAYRPFEDRVIIAADSELGRAGPGDFTHYGVEWKVAEGLQLRTGIDSGNTTFGMSLDLPFMRIHYAGMLDKDAPSGTVQMLGGEISFFEAPKRPMSVIRPKEYALIEIGGNIVGGVGDFSFLGGGRIGADSIVEHIKQATKDPYIDGLLLRIKGFDGGLGSLAIVQEIRGELLKSKAKGKKIVAYLEEGTMGDEYYLASVADKVIAPSAGTVGGIGKSMNIVKVKGLLEKLGIESQMLSKGKYKTTFNMYSSDLTKEQRLMIQDILADLYRQMVTDIESSRKGKISMEKLKEISDGSIYSAGKAKELGLIDEVGYYNDALRAGADLYGSKDDISVIDQKDLFVDDVDGYLFAFPNKIAVVEIDGDIVTGSSGQNVLFGGHSTGADVVCDQIRKAADDWQIKAIIVRINSGGGSAVASGQIYSELLRAKKKGKVIVASMGDLAASGGYYIASACNKIVADPGTITGSIGVVDESVLNYSGLLKMLGIKAESVKEGKHADMFSGLRKLSTDEVNSVNSYIEETYQEFIKAVADGRGMTTGEVASLAEGKVYTGSQAMDVKLVDKMGNFTDSVNLASEMAKLSGEPELVYYRQQNMFLQLGGGAVKMLGLGNGIFPDQGGLVEYKL